MTTTTTPTMKTATVSISKIVDIIEYLNGKTVAVKQGKLSNFSSIVSEYDVFTFEGLTSLEKFNKYENVLLGIGYEKASTNWFTTQQFDTKTAINFNIIYNRK